MATATPQHPSAPIHPSHALARLKFAQDMANALWAAITPDIRQDQQLVNHLAGWDDGARLVLAQRTGRGRVPSDGTWWEMLGLIDGRQTAERGEG